MINIQVQNLTVRQQRKLEKEKQYIKRKSVFVYQWLRTISAKPTRKLKPNLSAIELSSNKRTKRLGVKEGIVKEVMQEEVLSSDASDTSEIIFNPKAQIDVIKDQSNINNLKGSGM